MFHVRTLAVTLAGGNGRARNKRLGLGILE